MEARVSQVAWLGYPNTTGLDCVDYRLTDALADPPGTDQPFSEELVSLTVQGFSCSASQREVR